MTASLPLKHVVLYADDDADDQEFVRIVLEKYSRHLELVTVNNGLEALNFIRKSEDDISKICLIVLDINMPLMDGKEALLKLKSLPEARDIPVILFTTASNPADVRFAKENGAGFITKPIDYNQVDALGEAFIEHCGDEVKNRITRRL